MRKDFDTNSIYYQIKEARQAARHAERHNIIDESPIDPNPFWKTVLELSIEILKKYSKDLEICSLLIEATLRLDQLNGLAKAFKLLQQLLEQYWPSLYPSTDEDGIETKLMPIIALNGIDSPGSLIEPLCQIAITDTNQTTTIPLWKYQQINSNNDDESKQINLAIKIIFTTILSSSFKRY